MRRLPDIWPGSHLGVSREHGPPGPQLARPLRSAVSLGHRDPGVKLVHLPAHDFGNFLLGRLPPRNVGCSASDPTSFSTRGRPESRPEEFHHLLKAEVGWARSLPASEQAPHGSGRC